jgi:hypothetical protein
MHYCIPKSISGDSADAYIWCNTNSNLDVINYHRQDALSKVMDMIRNLLKDYQGSAVLCSIGEGLEYDAIVLGGLMRGLNTCGLPTEPPHSRLSFTDLARDLRNMPLPDYCSVRPRGKRSGYGNHERSCSVKPKINDFLGRLETELSGLRLEQFGRGQVENRG